MDNHFEHFKNFLLGFDSISENALKPFFSVDELIEYAIQELDPEALNLLQSELADYVLSGKQAKLAQATSRKKPQSLPKINS